EHGVSTIKRISALLRFPITWIVVAIAAYVLTSWVGAIAALISIPFCGYVAIILFEELDRSLGGLRALTFFLFRRRFFVRLLAERKAIRNEILSLGKESPMAADSAEVREKGEPG